jgi:hypothetical protein
VLLLFAAAAAAADSILTAAIGVSIILIVLMESCGVTVLIAPTVSGDNVEVAIASEAADADVDDAITTELAFAFDPSPLGLLARAGLALAGTRVPRLRVTAGADDMSSFVELSPPAPTASGALGRAGVA